MFPWRCSGLVACFLSVFLTRVFQASGLKQRASCARLLLLHFHPRRFRVGGLGPDATPAAKTEVMRV